MISADTYEEVYEILKCMNKITVMKIPENILLKINTNRNRNFTTSIDPKDIFNENNINKETVDFLCWLDYTYWRNDIEKVKIDKIIQEKNSTEEILKRNKYNPDNIFKQKENIKEQQINSETISLAEYKEPIFKKIKKLILKLLHIN